MKILFTGGFTLGSVTPLLAVVEQLKKVTSSRLEYNRKVGAIEIFWIGTRRGPERKLVEGSGIKFSWFWAPKWRRYFDVRNVSVPLWLGCSVVWSAVLLLTRRPDVIVTAGGFVGVPICWAGWFLRIPILLHNQDVRWSFANKLVAPFARKITYALPATVSKRWQKKSVWTGNPVREFIFKGNKERGLKLCGFDNTRPTILVIGGGTGAKRLNEIVAEALPELVKKYQVIHLTGRGKSGDPSPGLRPPSPRGRGEGESRYCAFEFVTREIADLYAAADVVITRAGMGALTELAELGKPMIIVPLPNTHQEDNARYFENKRAAVVFNQAAVDGTVLNDAIDGLVADKIQRQALAKHAKDCVKSEAARQVAKAMIAIAKK